MLHLIDQMTKVKHFCVSSSTALSYRNPVGHVELFASRVVSQNNSLDNVPASKNISLSATRLQDVSVSGRIVDPGDHDFIIFYHSRGDSLSATDFLSAVLYAVATAAQASNDQYCRDLGGLNEKRTVVYRIHGRRSTDMRYELNYEDVRRGLMLLSAAVYQAGALGEMDFRFQYAGEDLGGGRIDRSDFTDSTAR